MRDERFKIVFNGEIGFGYELAEVKVNLQKNCGFNQAMVERLFSGGNFVLKKDIDAATANAFRDALQRQGAFCDIVPMTPPAPVAPPAPPPAIVAPEAVAVTPSAPAPSAVVPVESNFSCPACGQKQEKGETCSACGIVFARYARAQAARRAREEAELAPPPAPPLFPTFGVNRSVATGAPAATQSFVLQCLGLVLGIALFQSWLGSDLMFVGLILLPIIFLGYLALHAAASGESLAEVFEENLAFLTEHHEAGAPKVWIPWTTYSLVLVNLLLYYGVALQLDPAVLFGQFAFYPAEPNSWNILASVVTALFLHANGWQLWGSLLFLWAAGSVVEERFGRGKFLALYLMSGILANGAGILAQQVLLHEPLHGLGSSGAIAGLIGVCVLGAEARALTFPLPLIGAIALFQPLSLKLRLSTFAVIGLFFYANLAGHSDPQTGMLAEAVGHLAHLGGMLAGMLLALLLKPAPPRLAAKPL